MKTKITKNDIGTFYDKICNILSSMECDNSEEIQIGLDDFIFEPGEREDIDIAIEEHKLRFTLQNDDAFGRALLDSQI